MWIKIRLDYMDLEQALHMDFDQAQQYGIRSGPKICIKIRSSDMDYGQT